jgi:heterodisulfide reductase subunit B
MKVSYFPGCTLNTTGKGFDNAVRASTAAVGLELVELPDWNCCGATYPLIIDNMLELAAPAHVLVAARDEGSTVTTACTTCYNVLKRTNKFIREHEEEQERLNAFIEAEYGGEVEVKDILHLLRDDVGFDAVQEKVQVPLADLKVASYYGCMVLRPPDEVAWLSVPLTSPGKWSTPSSGQPRHPGLRRWRRIARSANSTWISNRLRCAGSTQAIGPSRSFTSAS